MNEGAATVVLLSAFAVALTLIAWRDGTRCEISWSDVLVLGGLGILWRGVDAWGSILCGVVLGAGAIAVQIAIARSRGRRRPAFAGDAMLMGAAGAALGPLGLSVSWLLNLPAGLMYRWWLGRRRDRPCLRGYVPAGPAYCACVAVVLVWQAVTDRHAW